MKKFVLALFLFTILLISPTEKVYAQDPCSYVCRVPESVACIQCRNEELNTIVNTQEESDPCSYACRVPGSVECTRCRGENLNIPGSPDDSNDPCSYVCRVPGSVECKRCRGESLTNSPNSQSPLKGDCIDTAIGCIPVEDTNEFMGWILGWAIGVGGGIAFLLIVYASFMIMTSQGNPERLKAGQELLTSAISGLIMLIFSVFILKFIGVDILGLDKLGFGNK